MTFELQTSLLDHMKEPQATLFDAAHSSRRPVRLGPHLIRARAKTPQGQVDFNVTGADDSASSKALASIRKGMSNPSARRP
jgi:hypothetical protein